MASDRVSYRSAVGAVRSDLTLRAQRTARVAGCALLTPGERANEGMLSAEERSEYEALINADDFIAILRLKAQRHLDRTAQ